MTTAGAQPDVLRVAVETTPLADRRTTGVGNYVRGLLDALDDHDDVEVHTFCVTRGSVPGARRVPLPTGPSEQFWSLTNWPPVDPWATGFVDVVHGPNHAVPPVRSGTAATVMVHDIGFLLHPDVTPPSARRYGRLLQASLQRGAFALCASAFTRDELVTATGCDPDRTAVTHPGFVTRHHDLDIAPQGPPCLLYLGSVEARKNLLALLDAYALAVSRADLPPLVLAGPDGFRAEEIHRRAARADLAGQVALTGWLDDSAADTLLRRATAFVYPSLYEGFGMPPLEAAAHGVPVLATDAGSLPEVLGNAALLVEPDTEAIADGLVEIVTDDDLRSRLRRRGPQRAAHFSWEATAGATVEAWRRARDERRSA